MLPRMRRPVPTDVRRVGPVGILRKGAFEGTCQFHEVTNGDHQMSIVYSAGHARF